MPASNGATKSTKPSVCPENRTHKADNPWGGRSRSGPGPRQGDWPSHYLRAIFCYGTWRFSRTVLMHRSGEQPPTSPRSLNQRTPKAVEERMEANVHPTLPSPPHSSPETVAFVWPLGDPGSSAETFSFPLWSFIYFFKPSSHVFISGKELGFAFLKLNSSCRCFFLGKKSPQW